MNINIQLDLSEYSRQQLTSLVQEGVLSVKEYYDELADRNLRGNNETGCTGSRSVEEGEISAQLT